MKKYLPLFIFLFLFLSISQSTFAADTSATGFIPGQIWYSKDTLVSGDSVKIYTAIWNEADTPLFAHVEFYDKTILLGSRDVSVSAASLLDVSIIWKVTDGDHLISARITSSSTTLAGKKQSISVDNASTTEDHQFVPVVIKKQDGTVATSTDIIKSQVDKLTSQVSDILPASASIPTDSFSSVDTVRTSALEKVTTAQKNTQKEVDAMNATSAKASKSKVAASTIGGVEKPITYVKLFFLTVLRFILAYTIVYYGLILIILFYILRFIYRRIRNR